MQEYSCLGLVGIGLAHLGMEKGWIFNKNTKLLVIFPDFTRSSNCKLYQCYRRCLSEIMVYSVRYLALSAGYCYRLLHVMTGCGRTMELN